MLGELQKYEIKSEILKAGDYQPDHTDDTGQLDIAKKLAAKVNESNGLVIVSPEYNHSYPGELKLMLDMLYDEYKYKPVGICGVSKGGFGGTRVVELLKLLAVTINMIPLNKAMYFTNVRELFDEQGQITDQEYVGKVKSFIDSLTELISKIKQ
jgi:NAD(P)H-dependent FMN reductase